MFQHLNAPVLLEVINPSYRGLRRGAADRRARDLHHVVRPWSGKGLSCGPEAEAWCVRLLLLQGLDLLRNELNQLLKVLKLRRHELQQLLHLTKLLLLEDLKLLQLLWDDLKKLQNLLEMLRACDS